MAASAAAAIVAAALATWALLRRRARRAAAEPAVAGATNGRVEEASLESFPASDPPGWGGASL